MNLERAFAEYIVNELAPDEDIPRCEEEYREFLEGAIAELEAVPNKLAALPIDFVNLSLLRAVIKDGLENVDWDVVEEELDILMEGVE